MKKIAIFAVAMVIPVILIVCGVSEIIVNISALVCGVIAAGTVVSAIQAAVPWIGAVGSDRQGHHSPWLG